MKTPISLQALQKALSFKGAVLFFSIFLSFVESQAIVLCRHDKTVRTLRIEDTDNNSRCQAIYTKQGVDQVIGSSQSKTSCEEFVTSVRKNLEEGNWNCREVQQSKVSHLSEGT